MLHAIQIKGGHESSSTLIQTQKCGAADIRQDDQTAPCLLIRCCSANKIVVMINKQYNCAALFKSYYDKLKADPLSAHCVCVCFIASRQVIISTGWIYKGEVLVGARAFFYITS